MAKPEHGNTAQHKRDMEAYQAYKCNDRVAHILMLSNMKNDLVLHFENTRSLGLLIRQHLTIMSNMMSELRGADHELTDEQQVQAVVRSLPSSWEHLRINLTHNENIKTFDDVARHVELEEDRLLTDKPYGEAYMTESNKIRAFGSG